MRISDWSSDVCSSDLSAARSNGRHGAPGSGEVIVSAGGGAVGAALLRCALAARPLSPLAETPWRLLIGPNVPEEEFRAIAAPAAPGLTVDRARRSDERREGNECVSN